MGRQIQGLCSNLTCAGASKSGCPCRDASLGLLSFLFLRMTITRLSRFWSNKYHVDVWESQSTSGCCPIPTWKLISFHSRKSYHQQFVYFLWRHTKSQNIVIESKSLSGTMVSNARHWKYIREYTRGPSTFPSGKDWFMPRQTHKVEPSFIDHDLSYTGVQQQRWQMAPFVDIMVETSKIDYPPLISPWPSPTVVKLRSKVPIDSRE